MANEAATAHLIHGIVGSGKTTFARQLALDIEAVRFSPDEWMIALYDNNPAEHVFRQQHQKILKLIWEVALELLSKGQDVILDFGFWTRASRDEARANLYTIGAQTTLYFVDCDVNIARKRTLLRNDTLRESKALWIDQNAFNQFLEQFEPLANDEHHTLIRADQLLASQYSLK